MSTAFEQQPRTYGVVSVITNGPLGKPLAIGAVLYRSAGDIYDDQLWCLPTSAATDAIALKQLAATLEQEQTTHDTPRQLLSTFAVWFARHNTWTMTWLGQQTHLALGHLLAEMMRESLLTSRDLPQAIVDVDSLLCVLGDDLTAEEYVKHHKLPLLTLIKQPVHPIRASVVTAAVFFDMFAKARLPLGASVKQENSDEPPSTNGDATPHVVVDAEPPPPPPPPTVVLDDTPNSEVLSSDAAPTKHSATPSEADKEETRDDDDEEDDDVDEDDDIDDKKNGVAINKHWKRKRRTTKGRAAKTRAAK